MVVGKRVAWMVSVVLALWVTGCRPVRKQPDMNKPPTSRTMAARLAAALQIGSSTDRDEALSKVAEDAGVIGEVQVVTSETG